MKQVSIPVLQGLRGMAAISVAFFHLNIIIVGSHFDNKFVNNSWFFVDFFFVLSGFVIAFSYFDRIITINDLAKFQIKRFLRLYPLHLLMLFVFLGIETLKYIVEINFRTIANNNAFSVNNFSAFWANIFLVQNWTLSKLTYNYPSWSISAEFFTYGFFGILFLTAKANRLFLLVALSICVIAFGFALVKWVMATGHLTESPLRCLYSFAIGALMFLIYSKLNSIGFFLKSIGPLILITFSVFIITQYGSQHFNFVLFIPILFGITILSIALNNSENFLSKALSGKLLMWLGSISYGIYMIHACVWWVITQILRFPFKVPNTTDSEGKVALLINNIFVADFIFIFGILTVIFLANLSFKYFESRFTLSK